MPTARNFLTRGLLAGLIAGLVAFGVARVVGEPSLDSAISLEESGSSVHAEAATGSTKASMDAGAGTTVVPRDLQSTLGLLTGTVVIGLALGGLMGVMTAVFIGRLGRVSPRATALAVAAAGFVVVCLVPFLIYPPNPPGIGDATSIDTRSSLYFALLAISTLCAGLAGFLGTRLRTRIGGWYASLVGIGGYVVAMCVAAQCLPTYDYVGTGYPAQLLFQFRLGSLLTQAALWATIGVVLAELTHRLVGPPLHLQRGLEHSVRT